MWGTVGVETADRVGALCVWEWVAVGGRVRVWGWDGVGWIDGVGVAATDTVTVTGALMVVLAVLVASCVGVSD